MRNCDNEILRETKRGSNACRGVQARGRTKSVGTEARTVASLRQRRSERPARSWRGHLRCPRAGEANGVCPTAARNVGRTHSRTFQYVAVRKTEPMKPRLKFIEVARTRHGYDSFVPQATYKSARPPVLIFGKMLSALLEPLWLVGLLVGGLHDRRARLSPNCDPTNREHRMRERLDQRS